jgi:hypothetical protein
LYLSLQPFTELTRCPEITDYWGYELYLPPSQLKALSTSYSISSTLLAFFGAFVAISGAPELVPFLRYLSTYIDLEFKAIKAQDEGKGVVLAATCKPSRSPVINHDDSQTEEHY